MRIRLALLLIAVPALAVAQGPAASPEQAAGSGAPVPIAEPVRALAPVIARMQEASRRAEDATCVFHKQEYKGKELPAEVIDLKMRARPASIYMKWSEPEEQRGREAIWRAGWNDGKLCARSDSWVVSLAPDAGRAMETNRHPITDAGFAYTVAMLARDLEIGRKDPTCFTRATDLGERRVFGAESHCYEVETDKARCTGLYGYRAQFCVDRGSGLPSEVNVWDREDGQVRLVERYGYERIRVNVGLTDADFDPANPRYGFRQANPFARLFLGCQ